jgi:hypothetical protein
MHTRHTLEHIYPGYSAIVGFRRLEGSLSDKSHGIIGGQLHRTAGSFPVQWS